MTDRPLVLSADQVRAYLAGKTQDRVVLDRLRIRRKWSRVTEFGPSTTEGYDWHFRDSEMRWHDLRHDELLAALPCAVGDRLWVRENFAEVGSVDPPWVLYRASGYREECFRHGLDKFPPENEAPWRSSATMPRHLSRLTLIVTDVRVQRLQEISADDAVAEGLWRGRARKHLFWRTAWEPRMFEGRPHTEVYAELWDARHPNPAHQWAANPWVEARTFRVVNRNIDEV